MDKQRKVRIMIDEKHQNQKKQKKEIESVLTPIRPIPNNYVNPKKKSLSAFIKAGILALILGSVFGFGMMYIFSDLSPGASPEPSVPSSGVGEEEETNSTPSSIINSEAAEVPVVQLGLFSSKDNAIVLQENFNDFPTVIIEEEANYYLVTASSEENTTIEEKLTELNLEKNEDFIFKDWLTESNDIQPQAQEEWLKEGIDLASQNVGSTNEFKEEIDEWISRAPSEFSDNDYLEQLQNKLSMEENYQEVFQPFVVGTGQLLIQLFIESI
ncbi:hypothetical protein [Halalkalibacillus halophilus]|uniref:hypothetical protein n=1 Tax=Halalkalibacillus halophilus TaxID=392827 RepID=UPI0003FA76CC|nr:hypothetical protein [Halalkalibacillus halophilus]